jgi:hypothetical protein
MFLEIISILLMNILAIIVALAEMISKILIKILNVLEFISILLINILAIIGALAEMISKILIKILNVFRIYQ